VTQFEKTNQKCQGAIAKKCQSKPQGKKRKSKEKENEMLQ